MKKLNWKHLGLTAGLGLSLVAAGCSTEKSSTEDESATVGKGQEIELSYVEWDTEVASTNVIGKVLEDLGYDVKLTPLDNAVMWQAVASGDADAMVAAWLPATHGSQFEEYGDQMVDLGPNLEGALVGLVVPEYMDVDSIADLKDEAAMTITGIEPGAGVVAATEKALEELKNSITFKQLIRIVESLQAAVEQIPIREAFDELDTERAYHQDKRKESNERLIKNKSLIGKLIGFAPMVVLFCGYLIVPLVLIGMQAMTSTFAEMSSMTY